MIKMKPLKFPTIQLMAICAMVLPQAQAQENLIPNGTFQMYKVGDLSVTADFPAGNNFSGSFEGVITANGTVAYSDGTTGTTEVVMPGWETSPNGGGGAGLFNRGVGRGLDNNTTMETFAGWGGSNGDLIRTPAGVLGTVTAGGYILSAEVNGASSGDPSAILADLRLDLLADGVVIPPTSSTPPNTANNTWSFWTHTYDSATLAPFVGQDLTVEFGTNPTNTAGGRASWDNISLTAVPGSAPLLLTIVPSSETPDTFDFSWTGKQGKLYDLVTSTDLSVPIMDWPVYSTYGDLAADPTLNELIAVPSEDGKRFFAVVEKDPTPQN